MNWRGIDEHRAYLARHQASDVELFDAWVKANGIVKYKRLKPRDYIRYIQTGRNGGKWLYEDHCPPWRDHDYFFRGAGGAIYYVYQPYTPPDMLKRNVAQWARGIGLTAVVLDPPHSWYYPGSTSLVIITAKREGEHT